MLRLSAASVLAITMAFPAFADELNLYSARHYDTDLQLYDGFTEATGIEINLIEGFRRRVCWRASRPRAPTARQIFC